MQGVRGVIVALARRASRLCVVAATALIGALVMPAVASAHIERASYWPDPAPDCSINPCAGGAVPTARSLASAVSTGGVGTTRVVCRRDSISRLKRSIARATSRGYVLRPTQPRENISAAQGRALLRLNRQLARRC